MKNEGTALLVMDMQAPFVSRLSAGRKGVVLNIAEAIGIARRRNHLVIFVRLGLRKGAPEVGADNRMFGGLKTRLATDADVKAFVEIEPMLGMGADDIVVDKKRISAFSGNDLDAILRANGIGQVVLTGISTSGIVAATFYEALDKDYRVVVLQDACADGDEEMHRFFVERVFVKYGEVMRVERWK